MICGKRGYALWKVMMTSWPPVAIHCPLVQAPTVTLTVPEESLPSTVALVPRPVPATDGLEPVIERWPLRLIVLTERVETLRVPAEIEPPKLPLPVTARLPFTVPPAPN